jgi:hypothetical protein
MEKKKRDVVQEALIEDVVLRENTRTTEINSMIKKDPIIMTKITKRNVLTEEKGHAIKTGIGDVIGNNCIAILNKIAF